MGDPSEAFVQIYKSMMDSAAWRDLSPGGRAAVLEVCRFYNGSNNGEIFLSARKAGELLNVRPATAASYLKDAEAHGFIAQVENGCLGLNGKGVAAKWRLTFQPANNQPPTRDYKSWARAKN
ncbi:MAG: hypothetical protein AB7V02_06075 [Parvularculaceae bacterium]